MAVTISANPLQQLKSAGFSGVQPLLDLQKQGKIKVVSTLSSVKVLAGAEVIASIKISASELQALSTGGAAPVASVAAAISYATAAVLAALALPVPQAGEATEHKVAPFAVGDFVAPNGDTSELWSAELEPGTHIVTEVIADATTKTGFKYKVATGWTVGGASLKKVPGGVVDSIIAHESPAMAILTGVPQAPLPNQTTAGSGTAYPFADIGQPPVSLRDAVGLYRPVKGTSPGSRYFLVADFGDLKMAARWKSSTLSVRFEGNQFSKHAKMLVTLGVDTKKDYGSLHLTIDNLVAAQKAIGAMVFGTGLSPQSPVPHMEIVRKASSE